MVSIMRLLRPILWEWGVLGAEWSEGGCREKEERLTPNSHSKPEWSVPTLPLPAMTSATLRLQRFPDWPWITGSRGRWDFKLCRFELTRNANTCVNTYRARRRGLLITVNAWTLLGEGLLTCSSCGPFEHPFHLEALFPPPGGFS